ncbi:MAG: GerMN domain-containing protein [Actinomycetota bacterium]|nr:GerMN domain-containing protein [Actinomycetota bacterium]
MSRRFAIGLAALVSAALLLLSAGCNSGSPGIPDPKDLPTETTSTAVFFSTGRSLVSEPVRVDATNAIEETVREMLKSAPTVNRDIAIVQTTAELLSFSMDESTGVVTLDWAGDVLAFDAEPAEKRLAYAAILMTLGQFPEVEMVRFTVEGKDTGVIDGRDIQVFWVDVSLMDQPWDALRPPEPVGESSTETGTAGSD